MDKIKAVQNLRVFEAFAGYGSQALALERLQRKYPQFSFQSVGISEIDKNAIKAYNILHPGVKNYGDISKINWNDVPDFDLFTYSFPCTDISAAGEQKGLAKGSGTRSSLLWECERAIEIKRPKFLLMENVEALVSQKFIMYFHQWLRILEGFGYSSTSKILNATSFNVPQNRRRIFVVSILNANWSYNFPNEQPLTRKLSDLLEDKVDEKYYLKDEVVQRYLDKMNINE